MSKLNGPIGVMDSGIGGLTVVRELQRILPGEDIIYFGDSANCPYGNKTSEQITQLSKAMLRFLGDNGVKVTAIACNTISTLVGNFTPYFNYKIIGIVSPAADYIYHQGIKSIGLIATEFTVNTKNYDKLIHEYDSSVEIIGKGSPLLAALVDRGDFNEHDINTEITTQIDNILSRQKVDHVILGCTHYPIIEDNFKRCYPEITFVNPALEQAIAVRDYLASKDALSTKERGSFIICTTGDPQVYVNVSKRLGLFEPTELKSINILESV